MCVGVCASASGCSILLIYVHVRGRVWAGRLSPFPLPEDAIFLGSGDAPFFGCILYNILNLVNILFNIVFYIIFREIE